MSSLPNRITIARLGLSVVLFVILALAGSGHCELAGSIGIFTFMLYVLTASTDWLDGMLARKLNAVSTLGRILDPFADKVMTSGAFVLLCAGWPDLVAPWFTVIVLAREFFVSAIRNVVEAEGIAFGAAGPGKLKMILQSLLIGAVILELSWAPLGEAPAALSAIRIGLFWATLLSTIQSGAYYALKARRLLGHAAGPVA